MKTSEVDDIGIEDLFNAVIMLPMLFKNLLADVDLEVEGSYRPFFESWVAIAGCNKHQARRIEGIGLSMTQLLGIKERAWDAERAAASRGGESGDPADPFATERPQSSTMVRAIELLAIVCGVRRDRIPHILEVPERWVTNVAGAPRITEDEKNVVLAHLQGKTIPQIRAATGVQEDTAERIVFRWLGEKARRNRRSDSAERGRKAYRMHRMGTPVPEIAEKLGVSEGAVRKYIVRYRPRAAE